MSNFILVRRPILASSMSLLNIGVPRDKQSKCLASLGHLALWDRYVCLDDIDDRVRAKMWAECANKK